MGGEDEDLWWGEQDYWPPQEEPDCYSCSDRGVSIDGGRCRSCNPGRLDRQWQRVTATYWRWRYRREAARNPVVDEEPF